MKTLLHSCINLILFFPLIVNHSMAESAFTIEVVENPSFMEAYGDYVYMAIILLAFVIFFWRRHRQGRLL